VTCMIQQWQGPILTGLGWLCRCSSLAPCADKQEGVYFSSPVDGAKVFMGPEESVQYT